MIDEQSEEKIGSKLRDMDLFLKEKIVDLWDKAINYNIDGQAGKCFRAYKSLYHFIKPYKFSAKEYLTELTNTIEAHIKSLKGAPINAKQQIEFNERNFQFQELLDEYMSELPKAFVELDLWLKTVPDYQDFELRASKENFGSESTLVESKRSELSKLPSKKLTELMSYNAVHDLYSAYRRRENVL